MKNIPDAEAKNDYGITCRHDLMDNGELRFRLNSEDGSAYIRTLSGETGAWQNSHFHKAMRETYIAQKGWMAFARLDDSKLSVSIIQAGDAITIEPFVIHNVYLPAGAIIHTVKHGISQEKDWFGDEGFNKMTKDLTEEDIARLALKSGVEKDIDPRFNSYVAIYNNLDNLLWRIPSLFIGGAAILIGFVANIVSKPNASLSPALWSAMFILIGALFLLGAYSMSRIRIHHSRMGVELRSLESVGYFHTREETIKKLWTPGAPILFILVFSLLGLALIVLGLVAIFSFELLGPFLMQSAKP